MRLKNSFIFLPLFIVSISFGQIKESFSWRDPVTNDFPVIEGQAWPGELAKTYDRLPGRAKQLVNTDVWNLSHNSAGLYINFRTNASNIVIRYLVQNRQSLALPHMPATGVSGIDLYAIDHSGNWTWAPGRFSFGDTIEYRFSNMEVDPVFRGMDCEFRLFLPLYNSVSWMQIGVDSGKHFAFVPLQTEKPIVVYGTSIAQGGCASRPGLAWTAILQRMTDRPLINLGFSGSGKLDKPVIDLISEIDASLVVLDCLPNLTSGFTNDELRNRIQSAVADLQKKHPATPVLLVEHSGAGTTLVIDSSRYNEFEKVNKILRDEFAAMKSAGIKNIFLLPAKSIGLDINSTVDGVHPNDIGMEKHAEAYASVIRSILNESQGTNTTEIPVVQSRDGYDWRARHEAILSLNKTSPPANIILANSIIHYWGGESAYSISRGTDSWNKYLAPTGLRNLGFGWDRVENVLWRVYHGELDGYDAKHVVIMIGTNNLTINSDEEIIAGLKRLIGAVKARQPKAIVLISGIFPRRDLEAHVVVINQAIEKLAAETNIKFINPGKVLLNSKNKIEETLFGDGLHPNTAGYEKLGAALEPVLKDR